MVPPLHPLRPPQTIQLLVPCLGLKSLYGGEGQQKLRTDLIRSQEAPLCDSLEVLEASILPNILQARSGQPKSESLKGKRNGGRQEEEYNTLEVPRCWSKLVLIIYEPQTFLKSKLIPDNRSKDPQLTGQ